MVAHRPLEHPPAIENLSYNEILSNRQACGILLRDKALLLAKEYVTSLGTMDVRKKPTMPIEKPKRYALLSASPHKSRTRPHIREALNCLKRMQRDSADLFTLALCNGVSTIKRKIDILGKHVERIE